MKKFGVPPDPFAETDGTAAALRQIAEDGARKWHTRAAALLSLVQMAQMDHCRKGNSRSDTLQWLLEMLNWEEEKEEEENIDIRFALVSGLGTMLKGVEQTETKDGIMLVAAEDEPLLLSALKQSANGVVVEALADLKAHSDGLMDWVSNESSLIADGVWPMRHLLHVFCIKTATSGSQDRAEKLWQQLFGRVHAVSEETFNKEQDDVLEGLMICPAMRDDRLPLFLHLLLSGGVKQRSRVIKVAAKISMHCLRESRESLDMLAQALLSDVVEGCLLADLLQGGSLLADLLKSELNQTNLRQSSNVFRYLTESLGPVAEEGLAAPKRVVEFLVEFEKSQAEQRQRQEKEQEQGRARASASAIERASVENLAVAVEKSKTEQRQQKERKEALYEGTQPAQTIYNDNVRRRALTSRLSLQNLAVSVEHFMPEDIKNAADDPVCALTLYCATRLWSSSGLMQERKTKDIADLLSLSEPELEDAEDAFKNLLALKEPWVSGHGEKGGKWEQNLSEIMRNETRCLGRLLFTSFLEYIRRRQIIMKDSGTEQIEEWVSQLKPSDTTGRLEQQLLRKEVRIGRRLQELPSWAGLVSAAQCSRHKVLSLADSRGLPSYLQLKHSHSY
jgi:hypothetical protein